MIIWLGNLPQIVPQRPPRGARLDENGLNVPRQWSVLSTLEIAAIQLLQAAIGLRRGVAYQEPGGAIPDPYCLCQSIDAVGRPPAINGGIGQYIVTAEYSRKQTAPVAVPGGPTRWTRQAGLISTPVEIDAMGNTILSSSLEPPDPPLTAFVRDEILHADFYYPAASELDAIAVFRPFENKINEKPATRLGLPAGSILVDTFQAESTDTGWVHMSVDLRIRQPKTVFGVTVMGWEDLFPDRGHRAVYNGSTDPDPTNRFAAIQDALGNNIGEPLPLDGYGNVAGIANAVGYVVRPGPENVALNALNQSVAYGTAGGLPIKALICVCNYLTVDFAKIPFP